MHKRTTFGEKISRSGEKPDPNVMHRNVTPNNKWVIFIFRHNELPKKILTIAIKGTQTSIETNINEEWMDVEYHIPEVILKGNATHWKRCIYGIQ